jgi:hypothetical protein
MFFSLENVYSTGGFACGMKLVGSFDSWQVFTNPMNPYESLVL